MSRRSDLHGTDNPAAVLQELTESQLDEALRRLEQFGLINGRRHEASGLAFWVGLRPTADGLRILGEWPPPRPRSLQRCPRRRAVAELATELPDEDATAARRAGSALAKMSAGTVLDVIKDEAKRLARRRRGEHLGDTGRAGSAPLLEHPPEHNFLWTKSLSDEPRPELPECLERGSIGRSSARRRWIRLLVSGRRGRGWRMAFSGFPSDRRRQAALGLWPRFDALGSPGELAALLDALGRDAATEEERSNFRKAADAVRRSAPDVVRSALVGGIMAYARATSVSDLRQIGPALAGCRPPPSVV